MGGCGTGGFQVSAQREGVLHGYGAVVVSSQMGGVSLKRVLVPVW